MRKCQLEINGKRAHLESLKRNNEDVGSFVHSYLLASFHICITPVCI